MNRHEPPPDLERLAAAVAEGEEVDWEAAESAANSSEDSNNHNRRLQALKVLATLSALNESLQAEAEESETAPPEPAPAPPSPEKVIGQWGHLELLEKIGSGTSADVYRARDTRLDREVALKLLRSRGGAASRALREGRLLARVRHTNVATLYGADELDGRVGFWMELVRGRTLQRLVEEQGPMAAKEAALVGIELCRALAAVHQQGVVHRDIKAQNVMRAEGGRILLVDFGIGLDLEAERAGEVSVSGTPLYLAPEILAGKPATERSDLYSLGVLLFFLVTGMFPVPGENLSALRESHRQGKRRLLRDLRPDLAVELARVVEKATSPEPEARYSTAGALEQALVEVLREAGSEPRNGAFKTRRSALNWSSWKKRLGWAAVGLLATALGAGLFFRVELTRWWWLRKAEQLHQRGEREREIGVLRLGLERLPNDPLLRQGLADALIGAGELSDGFETLQRVFDTRERLGGADQQRVAASYYLSRLDYAAASEAHRIVANLDAQDDNALRDRAMLEMMMRNFPQATRLAEQATQLNPDDVINHGTLALALVLAGNASEALSAVQRGRELTGDLTYLNWAEGLARASQGNYGEAKVAFARLGEGEHTYESYATLLEAQVELLEGNIAAAKASLEVALEKDKQRGHEGERAVRYARLARLELLSNQEKEVRAYLRRLEEVPDLPIFLKALRAAALTYAELRDRQAVARVLVRLQGIVERYPTSAGRGLIGHVEGELARAEKDLPRALDHLKAAREDWGDPETVFSLARVRREAGRCGEALENLAEIQRLKAFIVQEHVATLWVLSFLEEARCQVVLGNREAAAEAYRRFLDPWGRNAPYLAVVQEAKTELAALSTK